ncbi:MAG TPA: hypothetical protein VNJ08_15900 [Bacteriovoracaceae bacterium]|nr:hypothetical protein [Bacteriovoracaceae bacterium]
MKLLFIKSAFAILFLSPQFLHACLPHEIYVRSHQVSSYDRSDGKKVREYPRSGHCRELPRTNYFQDSSSQKFKSLSTKLKKWNDTEKAQVSKQISKLPTWLAKYTIKEMLRANSDGTENPASSIPFTKTILFYDAFFKSSDQTNIIIHELAHIPLWDLEVLQIEDFARLSGWEIKKTRDSTVTRIPHKKFIIPDSGESISEDFANHIEVYYSSPERLKVHNLKSFQFIDKLIKQKEKP